MDSNTTTIIICVSFMVLVGFMFFMIWKDI